MTVRVQIVQGDTWEFEVVYYEPDGTTPVDITGYTARCQVRMAPDATPALTLTSSPSAGLSVDGANGRVSGRASPTQTEALIPRAWLWEVEIDNGTDRYTLNPSSKLVVKAQVTEDD